MYICVYVPMCVHICRLVGVGISMGMKTEYGRQT